MNGAVICRAILLLLFTLLSRQGLAIPAAWDRTDTNWQTRTSAHFELHYPARYDQMAQHALTIAERVHDELVPFFTQEPDERTQMVLVDDYDYSNGWATPFPFVQIRLFASPAEDVAGLEHMDEWLHGLIRHEYVHILHMNMSRGVTHSGRNVFGRLFWLFPHVFTPSMFTEGLAVYLETNRKLGYGRLDGSVYAMQMRMELDSHQGDDLNQVVVPLRDWPRGKHYLYGAYFWQYLAETYGEETMSRYLNQFSGQLIPYVMQNYVAKKVFGKSFPSLWNDYRQWLLASFTPATETLRAREISGDALPVLSNTQQVTAAAQGSLLQVIDNGEDRVEISRWQPDGPAGNGWSVQPLTATKGVTDADIAADGTLAVSRLISHASGRDLNDVFLWSEDSGWKRISKDLRLRKIRWLADGQQLIGSRKVHGLSELWRLQRDGDARMLWQGGDQTVLGSFDVAPDGQSLVASVKRPQQGWNLERLDLGTLRWQALTDTRATEHQPEFLPDGRILYSADYDGVFNLYVLQPATGMVDQWTQVVGGAFQPRWLNGQVAYQDYTSEGYQLKILTPRALASFSIASRQGRYDYPPAVSGVVPSERSDYSPWPTLAPKYWLPLFSFDDYSSALGLATSGNDAVGRHTYSIAALWDFKQDWADVSASYLYDNRWSLLWNRTHSYTDLNTGLDDDYYAKREDLLIVRRDHVLDAFEDQLQLHLGLVADHEKIERAPAGIDRGEGYEETLAGVALSFDNRELYRNVPGIGWGTYADLVYETNDVLNSDYDGYQWQASVKHTFDLPGRNTLSLGLAGGVAERTAEPFTLGGNNGEEALLFGRDQFALPGYEDNVQIGHKYYNGVLRVNRFLTRVERNWGMIPLGLGDISLGAWAQTASAWFRGQQRPELSAVGAELGIDVVLGYNLVLPVSLGVARGLDEDLGETKGYLRTAVFF